MITFLNACWKKIYTWLRKTQLWLAIYLPCTWPVRNNKQLCVGVCLKSHTATDSGRADSSFDDQRLKRLFGCWGWKLAPDWCMNIITLHKNICALICTQYFKWTLKLQLCLLPHSLIICDTAVPYGVKKADEHRKRNWAQSVGQIQPTERRPADSDISEDVKGGQTSGCAAGNYCVKYCMSCAWLKPPTQAAAERPGKKRGVGIYPRVCHSHGSMA